jgi:hypothetical protein
MRGEAVGALEVICIKTTDETDRGLYHAHGSRERVAESRFSLGDDRGRIRRL